MCSSLINFACVHACACVCKNTLVRARVCISDFFGQALLGGIDIVDIVSLIWNAVSQNDSNLGYGTSEGHRVFSYTQFIFAHKSYIIIDNSTDPETWMKLILSFTKKWLFHLVFQ